MKQSFHCSLVLLALLTGSTASAQRWIARDLGSPTAALGVVDFDMPAANVIWGANQDGSLAHTPVQDVFLSVNGGVSWFTNTIQTPSSAGKDLANIAAIDASTAFVAAYNPNAGPNTNTGNLFKTTDGGNTWSDVPIPSVAWLNFVHFFNPSEGLLMSDPDAQGYMLFRTPDGGQTWTRVPAANIPRPAAGDYGLSNQFAALGDHLWFGTFAGQVYHSPDRGLTWTRASTGFTSLQDTAALQCLAFSDASNGLVVSRDGRLGRTTDGGRTWALVTTAGPLFGNNLAAIPGLPGAYVTTGSNYRKAIGSAVTYDHGRTWALLDTAIQQTAVAFFDDRHGWAGGYTSRSGTGGVYEYVGRPLATAPAIDPVAPTLFPNPTTGLVRLGGTHSGTTVTVRDATGRVLRRLALPTDGQLDLRDLGAGRYLLTIGDGPTRRTARVAVER